VQILGTKKKKKREMCVTAVFVASSGHGGIWRGSDIYNNLIGLLSFHKIRTRPSRNQLSQLTPREREREREGDMKKHFDIVCLIIVPFYMVLGALALEHYIYEHSIRLLCSAE